MALQGFDKDYYLQAKLDALVAKGETEWADKDAVFLETVLLNVYGLTPEDHYSQYGYAEGLAPNACFNAAEYSVAKATQLFDTGHYMTIEDALADFEEKWQGDVYQHYIQYGSAEGINPSNAFDESSYLDSKLAALQADPDTADEWADKTADDVQAAFTAAGLTALGHYIEYGNDEGIAVTPVPTDERVKASDLGFTGETFVLTTDMDTIEGTAGDDTIFGMLNGSDSTFTFADDIDGGDGYDTLILMADDNDDNLVFLENVENVEVGNFAEDRLELDASEWSGVDSFVVSGGKDSVSFKNVNEEFSTVTIENFGYDNTDGDTVAIRVSNSTFSGDDDALTVILDRVGAGPVQVPAYTLDDDVLSGSNESIDGEYAYLDIDNNDYDSVIETYNFVSTGDNDRGNFLKVEDTEVLNTVNISGDTDLRLALNEDGISEEGALTVVDASALDANLWLRGTCISSEGLTITGATGDNDLTASSFDDTITTFAGDDIIKGGEGDDVINAGDGDNEVRGGDGADTITTGSGNDFIKTGCEWWDGVEYINDIETVSAGAGDDVVQVGDALAAGDSIDGGEGTDTLWMNADDAETVTADEDTDFADLFQNFEILRLGNLDAPLDMAFFDDIQHLILSSDLHTTTIEGLSDGATLELWNKSSNSEDVTTVNLTDTEGDETFNFVINANSDDDDFGTLVIDGVETINLSTATRCKDFDLFDDDDDGIDVNDIVYTLDISADALETLNISGDVGIDLYGEYLTSIVTVDAAALAGDLEVRLGSDNENDATITGGSGQNAIYGGAGDDTITMVSDEVNEVAGGAGGDDTITITGDGDNWVTGGSESNDVITIIGDGDNDLYGGNSYYDDELEEWINDDVFSVTGDGDNSINAGEDGADEITITGDGDNSINAGNDDDEVTITGDGDNEIYAGDGDDTVVVTGSGTNIIRGSDGLDTMTGGTGIDTYEYRDVSNSQGVTMDIITNFDESMDLLDFSTWDGTALVDPTYLGEASGYGSVLTALSGNGDTEAILDTDGSILYIDADGSGTLDDSDMAIQLTGVTDLSEANFIFPAAVV